MVTELEAETFSAEDSANTLISCSLSAIGYELLPNFKAILASTQARQHKIKLFEVLALMAKHAPNFLIAGNRFSEFVEPQIREAIGNLEPGDMFLVNLVKAQASLLNNLIDYSSDAEE